MAEPIQLTQSYEERKRRLVNVIRSNCGTQVTLSKDTSNLFRDRAPTKKHKLDVKAFNQVLEVNPREQYVVAEGMTTYEKLVDETFAKGMLPTVIPELKSITLGGAVAGVGIEASSFKFGLVHETILEMEILLGDGKVPICTPENEHKDLFFGFPNSYGTLGYALKIKVKCIPVKPYVQIKRFAYQNAKDFFVGVNHWCQDKQVDFVDGVIFGPDEFYLNIAQFVDEAPFVSDYTYKKIYYRSIAEKQVDYLTSPHFIWRWDTDWFWCSKNLYMQNPIVRTLAGKARLNSPTYTKIMRWNSRWRVTKRIDKLMGLHAESVIQDVDIPIDNAPEFLEFFQREIDIKPIWVCPLRAYNSKHSFDLYPLDPDALYINFGFWDVVKTRAQYSKGHFNKKIERKVKELGGIKSLYSDAYYTRDEFWGLYNKSAYDKLKSKYDPDHILGDLYEKCVLRK